MRCVFVFAALLLAAAGCRTAPSEERLVTAGTSAVYSPDGTRIAFLCDRGDHLAVGVRRLDGEDVSWVSDGPGNAAYPAWTPDGEIVFTYGHDTNTAYAAAHRKATDGGYNLYRWNGRGTAPLTSGRTRDYGASVSPDGTLWFVTTRGVEGHEVAQMCRSRIVKMPSNGMSGRGRPDYEDVRSFVSQNSGAMQPTVSPDGRFLLWCEMRGLRAPWQVMAARVGREDTPVALTPMDAVSVAPRWHPDGTRICYTACKAGDPGWCVYVQDLKSGVETRVCEGRNPCFSPDGLKLLYDRDGMIFERAWKEPTRDASDTAGRPTRDAVANFAYASFTVTVPESVKYVKTRKRSDNLYVMSRRGKGIGDAMAFFLREGLPVFASRNVMGEAVFARLGEVQPKGRPTSFVCICGENRLFLYRDGRLVVCTACPEGLMSFDGMAEPLIGENHSPLKIENFKAGVGWPDDVPKPPTRERLFGGAR